MFYQEALEAVYLEFCNDNLKEHMHKISRIGLKDKFADDYGDQNSLLNKMILINEYYIKKCYL